MDVELPGDGIGAPSLDVVIAQAPRAQGEWSRSTSSSSAQKIHAHARRAGLSAPVAAPWWLDGTARRVCGLRVDAALARITSSGAARGEPRCVTLCLPCAVAPRPRGVVAFVHDQSITGGAGAQPDSDIRESSDRAVEVPLLGSVSV